MQEEATQQSVISTVMCTALCSDEALIQGLRKLTTLICQLNIGYTMMNTLSWWNQKIRKASKEEAMIEASKVRFIITDYFRKNHKPPMTDTESQTSTKKTCEKES